MISKQDSFNFIMKNIFHKCETCSLFSTLKHAGYDIHGDSIAFIMLPYDNPDIIPEEDYNSFLQFSEAARNYFLTHHPISKSFMKNDWFPFSQEFSFPCTFLGSNTFCSKCLEKSNNNIVDTNTKNNITDTNTNNIIDTSNNNNPFQFVGSDSNNIAKLSGDSIDNKKEIVDFKNNKEIIDLENNLKNIIYEDDFEEEYEKDNNMKLIITDKIISENLENLIGDMHKIIKDSKELIYNNNSNKNGNNIINNIYKLLIDNNDKSVYNNMTNNINIIGIFKDYADIFVSTGRGATKTNLYAEAITYKKIDKQL